MATDYTDHIETFHAPLNIDLSGLNKQPSDRVVVTPHLVYQTGTMCHLIIIKQIEINMIMSLLLHQNFIQQEYNDF